jgi:hypothetical protein
VNMYGVHLAIPLTSPALSPVTVFRLNSNPCQIYRRLLFPVERVGVGEGERV